MRDNETHKAHVYIGMRLVCTADPGTIPPCSLSLAITLRILAVAYISPDCRVLCVEQRETITSEAYIVPSGHAESCIASESNGPFGFCAAHEGKRARETELTIRMVFSLG